ncbi:hypothetical protein KI387_019310, partial [Taxus chinensis]
VYSVTSEVAVRCIDEVFGERVGELRYHSTILSYREIYVAHLEEMRLIVLMMEAIGCYTLPDSE